MKAGCSAEGCPAELLSAAMDNSGEESAAHDIKEHAPDAVVLEQNARWQETDRILKCDDFHRHINKYCNWENNSHQIVQHQPKILPKPRTLPSVTCAFGNLMAPKLVQKLEHEDLHIRQKAITWAVDLLATPENRVRCLVAGIVPALLKRLSEEDAYMKKQIACAFKHIAAMEAGCLELSHLGAIKGLIDMASSDILEVRENALDALHQLSFSETVRSQLVSDVSVLPFILQKTREEKDEGCINLGVKILIRCVAGGLDKEAVSKILNEGGIVACIELMKHANIKIQESAIQLLCLLGMDKDGKAQAVKNSGIPTLLSFLKGDAALQEATVAAALMSITVDIDAKKAFVKEEGTPSLLNLLDSNDADICLNALQLTSNIAEDQQGRKELQEGAVAAQNLLETSEKTIIKKSAEQTLQQLAFKHRPFC